MAAVNKLTSVLLCAVVVIFFIPNKELPQIAVSAQVIPPPRYDGFIYKKHHVSDDVVVVEAFFDPLCPDSRDSWPPLKRALEHYRDSVSFSFHPFPLPYHDNAFVACRALHIVNGLKSGATYALLEKFFKHQERFYTKEMLNKSRASIIDKIARFSSQVIGNSSYPDIKAAFTDRATDLATRVSFKFGCSRGVFGTPFFMVNGFLLSNADSGMNYTDWRSLLDPLLSANNLY